MSTDLMATAELEPTLERPGFAVRAEWPGRPLGARAGHRYLSLHHGPMPAARAAVRAWWRWRLLAPLSRVIARPVGISVVPLTPGEFDEHRARAARTTGELCSDQRCYPLIAVTPLFWPPNPPTGAPRVYDLAATLLPATSLPMKLLDSGWSPGGGRPRAKVSMLEIGAGARGARPRPRYQLPRLHSRIRLLVQHLRRRQCPWSPRPRRPRRRC